MSHRKYFLMGMIICLGWQEGQGSLKPDTGSIIEERKKKTYIPRMFLRGESKKLHRFKGQSHLPPFIEKEEEE